MWKTCLSECFDSHLSSGDPMVWDESMQVSTEWRFVLDTSPSTILHLFTYSLPVETCSVNIVNVFQNSSWLIWGLLRVRDYQDSKSTQRAGQEHWIHSLAATPNMEHTYLFWKLEITILQEKKRNIHLLISVHNDYHKGNLQNTWHLLPF